MIEVSAKDLKILRSALIRYGAKQQLRQLQEECAELIVAVNHLFRGRKDASAEFIEEFVDVYIVMFQLFLDVKDKCEFYSMFDYKVEKLKKETCKGKGKEVNND